MFVIRYSVVGLIKDTCHNLTIVILDQSPIVSVHTV